MGIFDEKLHMAVDMHMYNDRSIVYNIMMKILQLARFVSQSFYFFRQSFLCDPMKLFRSIVHIYHCLDLKLCASLVCWTRLRVKLFSTRTRFLMRIVVLRLEFFITKCTVLFLQLQKLYLSFLFAHFWACCLMIFKTNSCIYTHAAILACGKSRDSTSKASCHKASPIISPRSRSSRFSCCALLNRNQWISLLFEILLTKNTYFV